MSKKFTQINNKITSLVKAADKMGYRVHNVALECLEHCADCGDTTLIKRLCTELPAALRPKALQVWIGKYFPIVVKGGEWKLRGKKEDRVWRFEDAANDPYWTPPEAPAPTIDLSKFDFDQLVEAMLQAKLNKLNKAREQVINAEIKDTSTDDIDTAIENLTRRARSMGFGEAQQAN